MSDGEFMIMYYIARCATLHYAHKESLYFRKFPYGGKTTSKGMLNIKKSPKRLLIRLCLCIVSQLF